MSDTEPRRSRARRLYWAVPLVVIAMFGIGYGARLLLAPAGPDADPILATVNGHPIRQSYLQARMRDATPGDQIAMLEQRERFLTSLITEELLLQSVLATDFAEEPELRDEVKALVAEHLIRRRVGERLGVEEAEARRYYDEHPAMIRGETVRVSHIVLAERDECADLMAEIRDEASFAAAARSHSLDGVSGSRGGVLGRVMDHSGALGFEEQMFRMEEGEMRVFDGPGGCHLVRAGEREVPPLPPYEAVRERIHAFLRRQQEVELLRELVDELSAELEVKRF